MNTPPIGRACALAALAAALLACSTYCQPESHAKAASDANATNDGPPVDPSPISGPATPTPAPVPNPPAQDPTPAQWRTFDAGPYVFSFPAATAEDARSLTAWHDVSHGLPSYEVNHSYGFLGRDGVVHAFDLVVQEALDCAVADAKLDEFNVTSAVKTTRTSSDGRKDLVFFVVNDVKPLWAQTMLVGRVRDVAKNQCALFSTSNMAPTDAALHRLDLDETGPFGDTLRQTLFSVQIKESTP